MGAEMPDTIRDLLRAPQHPARSVACPHCGAGERRPCTTVSKRRLMPEPHPSRITAWARATAVCPTCQVAPGQPCHLAGYAIHGSHVHPERLTEAKETAA